MREIKEIIVHCSASDDLAQDDIKEVAKLHTGNGPMKWGRYDTHGRGWKAVGYHYFIKKDGTIQVGRSEDEIGAHTYGHNRHSIGICLSGERRDLFTPGQFIALGILIAMIRERRGPLIIRPHWYYDERKSCPNFDTDLFDV